MENIISLLVLALLGLLIPSFVLYSILLFINNILWGYKGLDTDKKSEKYKKQKQKLFVASILITIGAAYVWRSIQL